MPVVERLFGTLPVGHPACVGKGCSHKGMQGVDDTIGMLSKMRWAVFDPLFDGGRRPLKAAPFIIMYF